MEEHAGDHLFSDLTEGKKGGRGGLGQMRCSRGISGQIIRTKCRKNKIRGDPGGAGDGGLLQAEEVDVDEYPPDGSQFSPSRR